MENENSEFDQSASGKTPRFSTPSFRYIVQNGKLGVKKPRKTDSLSFPTFPRTPVFDLADIDIPIILFLGFELERNIDIYFNNGTGKNRKILYL